MRWHAIRAWLPRMGPHRCGPHRCAALLAAIVAIVGMVSAGCAETPAYTQAQGNYLPLEVGHRWELRAPSTPEPMVLQVTARDSSGYVVAWSNPFVPGLRFRFAADGPRVRLTGLDMGRGLGPIPAEVVYFDFSKREGETWTNATGRYRVTDADARVSTPAGTYEHCIEIETTDQQGQSMYWTFAPDVGVVRWGRGRDAYALASFRKGTTPQTTEAPASSASSASSRAALPETVPQPPNAPRNLRAADDTLRISLDANPATNESGQQAYTLAIDAGLTFVHLPPTWNEIEPLQGQYRWDSVDFRANVAAIQKIPINLNFRVVDTNNRSMPGAYANWRFNDQRLADRLIAALRALGPRTKGQVRWVAIGNEVDVYFATHQSEIAEYALLLRRVLPVVREQFPEALFTVNVSFGGISRLDTLREITDLIDCYSFTYYPMNDDFTMRAPASILEDLPRMVAAAGQKPLILQEVGYASAERLNSSNAKQAEFVTRVFEALRQHRGRVMGAAFLFMSDLPPTTVDELTRYYKLSNSENFKAYLATLGLRTTNGTPKPAWDAFVREGRRLKSGGDE